MAPKTSPSTPAKKTSRSPKEKKEEVLADTPASVMPVPETATPPAEAVASPPEAPAHDTESSTPEAQPALDNDKAQEIIKLLQKLQRTVNKTQRSVAAIIHQLEGEEPASKRRKTKEPSGFAKPSLLTDELCDFLAIPHGSKLARTEVTKKLTTYIKENNLQNPNNKREINLDEKLKNLLRAPTGTIVTFFNIQRFLTHYKKDPEEAAPSQENIAQAS